MPDDHRWSATNETLDDGQAQRLTISVDGQILSCRDVCDLWRQDAGFGIFFSKTLASMPFAAFFWEVRPITITSVDGPFECVVVDSPMLAGVMADSRPFGSLLDAPGSDDGIAVFENLGGDALLVAPCAGTGTVEYAHLAGFVRRAPEGRHHALWSRVGAALMLRLGSAPVWLSTSGLGVYWLHFRLDRVPKYYTYAPYRHTEANRW